MAGSRRGHPEGWPCTACLLSAPCSTDPATLPTAVPGLGCTGPWAQSSMGAELPDAGVGSDTLLSLSVGHDDSEVLPRDMGYGSGQLGRLNTSHQTEVQSLEISIMARRKKTTYAVLLERICKGNKKVSEVKRKRSILGSRKGTEHSVMNWRVGNIRQNKCSSVSFSDAY